MQVPSKATRLKAARIVNQGRVLYIRRHHGGYVAMVRGDSGEVYRVYVDPQHGIYRCTCPAAMFRRVCKHIIAVSQILRVYAPLH